MNHELKANELTQRLAQLEICTNAAQKYIKAYILQEKVALIQTKQQSIAELLRRTKSEYRQKLISQSDVYEVELEQNAISYALEDMRRSYALALNEAAWSQPQFIALDPSVYFLNLESDLIKIAGLDENFQSLRGNSYALALDQSNLKLNRAQEESKSKLDLFAEASRIKGEQSEQSDYQRDIYTLGVNWQIPIYGSSAKAVERLAIIKARSELELSKTRIIELEKNKTAILQQVRAFKQQLSTLLNGIELAKSQLKLSQVHFKNYRIGYAELRRKREELTTKELQFLEFKENKWSQLIQIATLLSDEKSLCY